MIIEVIMHSYSAISVLLGKDKKAQENTIERMVCSGGGAKGIVYSGAYKAVEETGLLGGINELSGASAGAITAALIAVGMSPTDFYTLSLKTNFADLMGDRVGSIFAENKEGVCCLTRDGKPLEEFIRQQIIRSVKTSIARLEHVDVLADKNDDFRDILIKFEAKNPRFTFADLAVLNRLFPNEFKRLIIPAVKFPYGDIQIFNCDHTPDVEIALACRASASLPVFLEPVEIELSTKKEKFVDGGFLDNLPTDYFDTDESGAFIKNKKPEKTMVLSFGDGVDNTKNPVFQALYGPRWDEIICSEQLEHVLKESLFLAKKWATPGVDTTHDEPHPLIHAVKTILKQQVIDGKMTPELAYAVNQATIISINNGLLTPEKRMEFWRLNYKESSEEGQIKLLGSLIKRHLKPDLLQASWFEKFKCNDLSAFLGDLRASYLHTEKFEAGLQKLRSEYPLRTVELRIGKIQTQDFNEAIKVARVVAAFGYLDTMNYIVNHELFDRSNFAPDHFYVKLVHHFEMIYQAVLDGSGIDPEKDPFTQEMASLKKQLEALGKSLMIVSRQLYQLIKDEAEKQLDSIGAFALSRAVELHNHMLIADDLFKETYEEGFKRSPFLSISDMSGVRFFRVETLHDSLKDKSMFCLYQKRPSHSSPSRSDKILNSLRQIDTFQKEYEQSISPGRVVMDDRP